MLKRFKYAREALLIVCLAAAAYAGIVYFRSTEKDIAAQPFEASALKNDPVLTPPTSAISTVSAGSTDQDSDQTKADWSFIQSLLSQVSPTITKPPANITKGYTTGQLMGNGDIGVVAGDTTSSQKFYFGKSDFWGKAVKDAKANPTVWQDSILSVGGLTISSPDAGKSASPMYSMKQDILNAEVITNMQIGSSTITMTSWTADSDNFFVTELSSPAGGSPVTLYAELWVPDKMTAAGVTKDNKSTYPYSSGVSNGILWVTRENNMNGSGDYKARVAAAVKLLGASWVSTTSGSANAKGSFTLNPGASVQVIAAIKSGTGIGSAAPKTDAVLNKAVESVSPLTTDQIAAMKKEHQAWWKSFWLKSFLDVHDSVLNKYYYGALYVLGISSRAGSPVPPSLWGNFVTNDTPGWGGRYFLNYNEEALYYGAFSSNRTDSVLPYNLLILKEQPYQQNKTASAGYKGTAFQRSLTPYNLFKPAPGLTAVAASKDWKKLPADQKSNAGFAAMPLIWYWEYTQDTDYLKTKLYPFLKQMDAFWRDYLEWDGTRYVVNHSSAHEGSDDLNPNLDIGFIRKLEHTLIQASQVLGVDSDLLPAWQNVLDKLSSYPTDTYDGQTVYLIAEKVNDSTSTKVTFEPGNQPINLEGGVFPGENIFIGGDPKELQIANSSLAQMNSWGVTSGGNTHNGFPKIWPVAARIGWPADDLVSRFKAAIQYLWRDSNITAYEGGGGIETSGSIEALNSMLMQSEGGVIKVFPAWPSGKDAYFKRLRTKGAFLVSSDLNGGKVSYIELNSEKGKDAAVKNPWSSGTPSVVESDPKGSILSDVSSKLNDGVITFNTTAGHSYKITSK